MSSTSLEHVRLLLLSLDVHCEAFVQYWPVDRVEGRLDVQLRQYRLDGVVRFSDLPQDFLVYCQDLGRWNSIWLVFPFSFHLFIDERAMLYFLFFDDLHTLLRMFW